MIRASETIADLAGALAKAQGAFENPSKDREVKVRGETKTGKEFEYTFRYATFTAIVDAVRKPLADAGLSFVQMIGSDEHGFLITTRLLHASGQWVEFDTPVFVAGGGPQAFGSGVTYAKRYALSTMLGVTADEDDDANAAEGNQVDMRSRTPNAPPRPTQARQPSPPPARPAATAPTTNGKQAIPASTNDEAAETFVSQSIEAIGKMKYVEALEAWWRDNFKPIGKLEGRYPQLYNRLLVAYDEMRDRLPHVTQAAE